MSGEIEIDREHAAGFVESYRRAWEAWDFTGFIDLFSDDVVYVAHATEATVVGRAALAGYIRKEADDQGRASVRMGSPVFDGWDPNIEYRPSEDLMPPDLEGAFHGHDGYLALWRYWRDAFDDIRWDPEEVLDLGDRLLVETQQRGHGSGSGVAVSEPVFQLFTFRSGLVIRQEDFRDRAKALEAAGLRK